MVEHFLKKNCNSTYCNLINSKLCHWYFHANITIFSEQLSLKHLQQNIRSMKTKFLTKYSQIFSKHYHYFQIFSIFAYDKGLMVKSYQLLRFYKRFYKEGEKTLIQQSRRIEKLGKVGLCFISSCFIKPFKMIMIFPSIGLFVHKIFIFFASSFAVQFFSAT